MNQASANLSTTTDSSEHWEYFLTPPDAWDAMLSACENAAESIDFEQYIFKPYGRIGREFIALFARKAKEGVKVRLMIDALGSWEFMFLPQRWSLKKAGVEVQIFNPPVPWRLFGKRGLFPRDHRKIALIDGNIAYMGGVCIDESMRDWRDSHVKITGPVVRQIQATFDSLWENNRRGVHYTGLPPSSKNSTDALFINEPVRGNHQLRDKILKRMVSARKEILITTPYFVPTRSFTRLIFAALKRGVNVRIMTSGHCNQVSNALGKLESGKFIRRGARVYSYMKCMLHTKTILIDDDFIAVGSFNINSLSFYHNQEADIVSTNPEVVAEFRRQFEDDLTDCRLLTIRKWRERHWYQKLLGKLMLPFKRYL